MNRLFQDLTSAADGAFVINDEQYIIYWNPAAQEILGYVSAEVTDQLCYEMEVLSGQRRKMILQTSPMKLTTALAVVNFIVV